MLNIIRTLSVLMIIIGFRVPQASAVDAIPSDNETIPVEDSLDAILDGFDDDGIAASDEEVVDTPSEPGLFSLDGHIKVATSLNISHDAPKTGEPDWRYLSRILTGLQLELNGRLHPRLQVKVTGKANYDFAYTMKNRDDFTTDVLDNYESELELGEAYVQGRLTDHIDIKLGRQIVAWGKSDNVRVTDVLNPLDIREPGLTDIEDLRLPVGMTRLDFYAGPWNITGIALHEIRFDKMPEFGSDFYPSTQPPIPEMIPSHGGENTEFAAAVNGTFQGWDLSFYWTDMFNDLPHIEIIPNTFPLQTNHRHTRLTMLGAAANVALGNWLVKTEAAHFNGLRYFNTAGQRFSRTDVAAGIEYSGFDDTMMSLEVINRHIHDFTPVLEMLPDAISEDQFQSVVRLTRMFFNDTFELTFLASLFGAVGEDGSLQRFSADYDYTDALKISGGIVLYQSGDRIEFSQIGDNDRLFFEAKYSF